MFKKVKINYTKGKLRQIRFFNIPVFEYGTENGKKIRRFSLAKKINKSKPVFYLKFNSANYSYSLWCLHHWINIVHETGCDFYIVCDNYAMEYKILENIPFPTSNIKFIKSDRKTFKKVIDNICDPNWIKAGYAHFTTFIHAKKNGIKEFWNIDVDDTAYYATPDKVAKTLNQIMQIARDKDIDIFSMDMHFTRFYGKHWSFGVAFIQNKKDICSLIEKAKNKKWQESLKDLQDKIKFTYNADWYFTYLRNTKQLKLESFNIDNLYFIHFGLCIYMHAFADALQVTRGNNLYLPFFKGLYGDNKLCERKIHDDVLNIDCNFDENESSEFLKSILTLDYNMFYDNCREKDKNA